MDHANSIFQNVFIILSNLPFILPGIACLNLKKHVQAFVYFSILITSSLYHACKFGSEDVASPGGLCVIFDFDVYFVLDHVFAMLTIPCLLLSFTPLDVIIFDFRDGGGDGDDDEKKGEKFASKTKKELRTFLFENYFSSNMMDYYNIGKRNENADVGNATFPMSYSQKPQLTTAYNPTFEITKKNILSVYGNFFGRPALKTNMVGLENIYICSYAYLIAASLIISFPNFVFTAALCSSSLLVALTLGSYFYFKYGVVSGFKSFEFFFGLALSVAASTLMLAQDHLPGTTYWITHSVWHICAAVGQWLLLKSKYRFSCYYRPR